MVSLVPTDKFRLPGYLCRHWLPLGHTYFVSLVHPLYSTLFQPLVSSHTTTDPSWSIRTVESQNEKKDTHVLAFSDFTNSSLPLPHFKPNNTTSETDVTPYTQPPPNPSLTVVATIPESISGTFPTTIEPVRTITTHTLLSKTLDESPNLVFLKH